MTCSLDVSPPKLMLDCASSSLPRSPVVSQVLTDSPAAVAPAGENRKSARTRLDEQREGRRAAAAGVIAGVARAQVHPRTHHPIPDALWHGAGRPG